MLPFSLSFFSSFFFPSIKLDKEIKDLLMQNNGAKEDNWRLKYRIRLDMKEIIRRQNSSGNLFKGGKKI